MPENQATISRWAHETFGPAGSAFRVAARANEEMAELLRKTSYGAPPAEMAEECADVVIVLYRLVARLGYDLHEEIDRKMAINRQRHWHLDDTGHGYHVREKPQYGE